MIKDYNFEEIKKYLKKDSEIGEDILEAFDSLADAAMIFSPLVFGPEMLPLLNLLDVKDRLMNLGRKVYTAISKRIETDYITRTKQIRAAYALICYTAYFDALQNTLPKDIIKKLKLKIEEKNKLIENADETYKNDTKASIASIHCNVFYADHVTSLESIKDQLLDLYTSITNGLIKMIIDSSIYDENNKKDAQSLKRIKDKLSELPRKAVEVYEAQYLYLADNFSDFALFAQMESFERIEQTVTKNEKALKLLAGVTNKIDIGLSTLNEIVNSLPSNYARIQSQSIVDELKCKYNGMINEPIIKDEEIKNDQEMKADDSLNNLKFPKIVDAFIPQSYKCLLYKQKGTKLENNSIWDSIAERNDIDKFFVKYLYSLDSIDYPLIILGQPGSGKSLLTKVLSAQLMSNSYTVVRIPLRDVNADDNIDVLVEDQIRKMINRPLSAEGYGGFASQFNEKPLIIILDGYDELLQAKGSVFSSYLEKVRTFQQNQKQLNRPVRIIVTSRITLIDKARIPINSTILRLMEFNQQQRDEWIKVWNNTNTDYFLKHNIQPFSLIEHEKEGKNNIIELAEQPLLLLMLALYDSEKNELAKTSSIKRTELYDNLLRRFVRRERSRYVPGFEGKSSKEQEKIIDSEMNRLGVIAIGMYNRRDVVIRSEQLEKDLESFEAHRKEYSKGNATLTDAESALGGFFFIHKSTAQDVDANNEDATNAYEFLHNTFGEFLAADFILRNTIIEIQNDYIDKTFKSDSSYATLRLSPESIKTNWFYCLMFVPLYSRPVVVEMMREHATKAFNHYFEMCGNINIMSTDCESILKDIVRNQLKMILNTRNCPKVMRNGTLFDNDMPLIGYLATYTLNLIILASTISKDGFEFVEDDYRPTEKNEHDLNPWGKLTSLWKSWFSPADLIGLSVVLRANRENEQSIIVRCNDKFEATRYEQPIDILLCLSTTLADTLLMSLSGLNTTKFQEITHMDFFSTISVLRKENADLFVKYLIMQIRKILFGVSNVGITEELFDVYDRINYLINEILEAPRFHKINSDTRLELFEVLEMCLSKKLVFLDTRRELIKHIPKLMDRHIKEEGAYKEKRIIIYFNKLIKLLVPNQNFILASRRFAYEELRYKSYVFGSAWSKDFDYLTHINFSYKNDASVYISEVDENKSFLDSLISLSEMPMEQYTEKHLRFIEWIIVPENIRILLQADPKSLSQALLLYLERYDSNRMRFLESVKVFFKELDFIISKFGIGYLGFETVINAIKIARLTKLDVLSSNFEELIFNMFRDSSPELYHYFLNYHPDIVDELISLIPNVFCEVSFGAFGEHVYRNEFRYHFDRDKILKYIRVVRKLYDIQKDICSDEDRTLRNLYNFSKHILSSLDNDDINFDCLSVQEIDDIFWCISYLGNQSFKKKIIRKLNNYPFLKSVLKD